MLMKQLTELFELLDQPAAGGAAVCEYIQSLGPAQVSSRRILGARGGTDAVRILIAGENGKAAGGSAPTLGIVGRLGGLGARPERIGFVSDGEGALAALTAAAKLADMSAKGDRLPGDVIVCTHICPDAPTSPHEPVPFMGSPVNMGDLNAYEVDPAMDAILSIDTTRGNRLVNVSGVAITPTVRQGWILRVPEDLLTLLEYVSGTPALTIPITMQDITPYGNGVFHMNSILQPCTATKAPVVGVAITSGAAVPGCGTGATGGREAEVAARFAVEAAKAFGAGKCAFYDPEEADLLLRHYGSMAHLQEK
ncbi:MAG: DUF1177 domain-containing protein [Clostridiaceae bacterium]|nr:DUF1177 domain-containing protein [Clostridiaceae bacterium]